VVRNIDEARHKTYLRVRLEQVTFVWINVSPLFGCQVRETLVVHQEELSVSLNDEENAHVHGTISIERINTMFRIHACVNKLHESVRTNIQELLRLIVNQIDDSDLIVHWQTCLVSKNWVLNDVIVCHDRLLLG
jgi:hypothetical protein